MLKFDKHGACVSPQTRAAFLARLDNAPNAPVILFSHGWNNDYSDAVALYRDFLLQLQAHWHQYSSGPVAPIFLGVIWPSTWLSFDHGPDMASATPAGAPSAEQALGAELAALLPDAQQARLLALLARGALNESDAQELGALLAGALRAEARPEAGDDIAAADAGAIVAGTQALRELDNADNAGAGLDGGGTVDGGGRAAPLRDAGPLDYLDPRQALRVASVYQMKDRAGTVGRLGLAPLLGEILARCAGPLHALGHSYGAKVVLSSIAAAPLPRPLASVLLLEPAVSHLCFAEHVPGRAGPGGYRAVLERIAGSLLMTYSGHDFPLHEVFHRALRRDTDLAELGAAAAGDTSAGAPPNAYAALGGYGPRGAGEALREPLPEPGTSFVLPAGSTPLAFDGTLHKRINGHGDVRSAYTAWLLYVQMSQTHN
ncbi:hypothetical protein [Rugamonas sp. DEMB1]|uniref:hypothetical protein n=1 Tax=Rugamonas sp. DEMB1 TaxID=3039386 RepID=UPI00244C0E8C|nr:hypothetical protein [Rugamonas sp. DEMB1]WGG48504.1 hypothetical protein QC826_17610 [Rugamonas sp. DEMB1]